ncbi:MAG: hypothetical protein WA633_18105, partial [Stellaceae bacterium]
MRDAGHRFARIGEYLPAGRRIRARRHQPCRHRRIQRQDLIFGELGPHQFLHVPELLRIPVGDVVVLGPV